MSQVLNGLQWGLGCAIGIVIVFLVLPIVVEEGYMAYLNWRYRE